MTQSVTITIPIEDQTCYDILTTAVEGGIGYWSMVTDSKRLPDLSWVSVDLVDAEDENEEFGTVDKEVIVEGIQRILDGKVPVRRDLYEQVLSIKDDPDIDADAADCIVQAGLFGRIDFG